MLMHNAMSDDWSKSKVKFPSITVYTWTACQTLLGVNVVNM